MDQSLPYPLRLEGDLSPRLSRGLWLVKWVLVVPHAIVLFFLWIAFVALSVLALFAILFANRYPRGLYDLVVGMNRWCLRVVAYAALMTDEYPPFRLDMGDHEPPSMDAVAGAGPAPLPAS